MLRSRRHCRAWARDQMPGPALPHKRSGWRLLSLQQAKQQQQREVQEQEQGQGRRRQEGHRRVVAWTQQTEQRRQAHNSSSRSSRM